MTRAPHEDVPRYPYLLVDVAPELSDEMSAVLFELGAQGVEERDASTLARSARAELVTLVASFADYPQATAALEQLDDELSPRIEEVVGDDWRDAWKEHFRPFALAPGLWIKPPWEAMPSEAGSPLVLELEPGRAFGTGLHATTSLVAGILEKRRVALAGIELLDVGTGSGILALVALLLGADRARATDVDADAIEVARENATRNHLEQRLSADSEELANIAQRYPLVLANIEARVLIPMALQLGDKVLPGGTLVLSGILLGQEEEIASAYCALRLVETVTLGEWVAMVFTSPSPQMAFTYPSPQ